MYKKGTAMKIVLAYSGGLDTSIILKWVKEKYNAEVIAYCADVGQGNELDGLEEKALKTGASKIYIEDLRKEFVDDFIFPCVKANAVYEDYYLLGTSIARPVIAKRMVEIAIKEGADAIAHGATGKGNDQVRFEATVKALAPRLKIIAPWREWNMKSREDLIDYAEKHGIPIPVTKSKPYSTDRNILHISYEGGVLEDPYYEPDESIFLLSVSPEKAPDKGEYIELDFEKGVPVALNGKSMDSVKLFETLNEIGGRNGIGRVDMIENRLVGIKCRCIYETPGGTILIEAHKALESMTIERDTAHYKKLIGEKYAEIVYYGLWFSPLKKALDAFIEETQKYVSGRVKIKLCKGNLNVVGRKSECSLYDENLATFGESDYKQSDAEGFINLFTLTSKVACERDRRCDKK